MLTIPYAPGKNNFFTKFQFFNFGNIELSKSRQCERRPSGRRNEHQREVVHQQLEQKDQEKSC